MRMDDTAFAAEVLRRSEVYRKTQRQRRKQLTAGMLAFVCCAGIGLAAFALYPQRRQTILVPELAVTQNGTVSSTETVDGQFAEEEQKDKDGIENIADDGTDGFMVGEPTSDAFFTTSSSVSVTASAEEESYPIGTKAMTFLITNNGEDEISVSSYPSSLCKPSGETVMFQWDLSAEEWERSTVTIQPDQTAEIAVNLTAIGDAVTDTEGTYIMIFDSSIGAEFTMREERD